VSLLTLHPRWLPTGSPLKGGTVRAAFVLVEMATSRRVRPARCLGDGRKIASADQVRGAAIISRDRPPRQIVEELDVAPGATASEVLTRISRLDAGG
jgi:hypothetical protein